RLMERTAREFEERRAWVDFDTLAYESQEGEVPYDINEAFRLPHVLGGVWQVEEVNLSALGLVLAGTAPRTVQQMASLARICGDRKYRDRASAIISSSILREEYDYSEVDSQAAVRLIQLLPGVSAGGRLGDEWELSIFRTALDYRRVNGPDDLRVILEQQAEDRLRVQQAAAAVSVPTFDAAWSEAEGPGFPAREVEEAEEEPDPRSVFIVHGRDQEATDALWSWLQDIGLRPLDWSELVSLTGQGSPVIADILEQAFKVAIAIVVLMTPDEVVRLHGDLVQIGELPHDREPGLQPRPNVVFEAGMAFGKHPARTIIVELGRLRPISDLSGRHTVRLATQDTLKDLAQRLETAGCPVVRTNPAWLDAGRFAHLQSNVRSPLKFHRWQWPFLRKQRRSSEVRGAREQPRGLAKRPGTSDGGVE
ncbi:MAG TPA: nucleotide-binding protein, partial [Acidimicrobiales bacterium]|nr:nucleotide-binding protein [Acidimicrobiales bacterium]